MENTKFSFRYFIQVFNPTEFIDRNSFGKYRKNQC